VTSSQARGQAAEDFALNQLNDLGFTLVERNFRCKGGEIDLVMMDGKTLVFVEVRYRANNQFGDGAESVDRFKQRKLRIAAETWLQQNQSAMFSGCRFDVISVSGEDKNLRAELIDDAF
jgi:putative endonuclease